MDKDTVLADFQACTGISDVAYSLALLEAHDWDLTGAVTSALADGVADTDVDVSHLAPGSNQAQPSPYSPVTASVELDDRHPRSRTNSGSRPPRSPRRPSRSPGGSRSRTSISQTEPSRDVVEMDTAPVGSTGHVRILHFEIRLELPWGGSSGSTDICSECFTFPETETVRSLKRYFVEHRLAEMIQLATSPEWASEIPDVTPNSLIEHLDFQHTGTHNFSDDSVTLRTLHLPKFNTIDAKLKHTIAKRESTPRIASLAHIEINIHIKNPDSDPNMDMNDGNVRPLRLQPGWRVSQLRHDASSLTGIPVNRQIWSEAPKESGSNGVIARLVEELNNIPGVTSKKSAGRGVCESPSLTDLGLRSDGVYNLFLEEAPSKSSSHVSTRITANPPAAGFSIQSTAHVSSPSCESEMETESRSEQPSTSKRTTSRKQSSQPKMGKTLPNDRVSDIEDDLDYDDDAEDRYSSDEAVDQFKSAPWSTPLIPDTHYGDDPGKATEQFCQVFLQRYCGDGAAMAPPFATCSLDAALAASAGTPTVSERKPLFIYLHNDESVACHVFCQQILCSTGLGQFLGDNGFCLWPWDVTAPRSRERLLGWLENKLPNLATIVTPLSVDSYPVLAMVGKLAGQLEVLCVVLGTGAVTGPIQRKPDDLSFPPLGSPERRLMKPFPTETSGSLKPDVIVAELWQAYTTYTELLAPELAAEAERLARQRVREEQEAAYRESLRKDKQKAIERAAAEELERLEKERVEAQKRSEKNKATQRRLAMAASLPSEPPAPNTPALNAFLATSRGSAGIASLRFRLPRDRTSAPSAASGSNETPNSTLARRFAGLDVLKDVFAFVESQGFPISDYKVLTSYPRRDLTTLDENETLADLKLVPQETLTLEQR
ncbi:unnamed protein product [Calicophoron daubneyi]|uniref:UBX domain-containing protein n=1 Tax=Calicophoron daubneyi TaxID=300641 RepID=A0AAV2TXZ1_CALDB